MNPASQRHFREIAELRTDAMTPTIKRASLNGENPLWFTQGTPEMIHLQARATFMGQGPSEHAKRQSAVLMAAHNDGGWGMVTYRVSGFQSVKVLQKEGRVLTDAGAEALISGQYQKIAIDQIPDDAAFGLNRQRSAEQLARWMSALPESTLNHAPTFAGKLNQTLLSDQYKLRYDESMPFLATKQSAGRIHAPQNGNESTGHDGLIRKIVAIAKGNATDHWATTDRYADASALRSLREGQGIHDFLRQHGFQPIEQPTLSPEPVSPGQPPAMTIKDLLEFNQKLSRGEVTADAVRATWEKWNAAKETVLEELGGMTKKDLERYAGYRYAGEKKDRMVQGSYTNLSGVFVAGGMLHYIGLGVDKDSHAKSISAQMGKWTDEMIQAKASERRAEFEAANKAITNPETLEEFDTFVRHHGRRGFSKEEVEAADKMKPRDLGIFLETRGEAKLSPEQRIKFDELRTLAGRKIREAQVAVRKEVAETSLPAGVTMTVTETKHTTKGHALWAVRLTERVDGDRFKELATRAKQLGGYYSSYARDGAIPGFQFDTAEKAQRFMSLERVDGTKRLEEQRADQQQRAVVRLTEVGEKMIDRGEDSLSQDRKTNTARRASMASNMEGAARREIQLGQTAVNLANMIDEGKVKFLTRVNSATKVGVLEELLSRSQSNRITADERARESQGGGYSGIYTSWDKERAKPIVASDLMHAEFPWPVFHTSNLFNAVAEGDRTAGAKLAASRVERLIATRPRGEDMFTCRDDHEVETIRDLAVRLGRDQIKDRMYSYDRLREMDVRNVVELRATLREYLTHREELQKADPLKQAERALIGLKIPGFFPTPERKADEIVARADIRPGMRVLEPSVGKADIYDAIKRNCPEAKIDAVEMSHTLISYLEKKGVPLAHKGDFLDFNPGPVYDRIVMNPPFEDGQDMAHVRHAHSLLAPGGKLVAIVSEGPFFRNDNKAQEFRDWLVNGVDSGTSEKNPADLFSGAEAFRQTGTQTRTIEISRAPERVAIEEPMEPSEPRRARVAV